MKATYGIVLWAVSVSCVFADEIILACDMRSDLARHTIYLRINQDNENAELVQEKGVVTGSLLTTEVHYMIVFPKMEGRWETHIAINRISGTIVWEHGNPPFNELSEKNVHQSGACETKSGPLF